MLIICPTCSSSYLIRATEIGTGGRLVRCGACRNSWQVDGAPQSADGSVDEYGSVDESRETSENIDESLSKTAAKRAWSQRQPGWRFAIGGLAAAAIASAVVLPLGRIADVARTLISRVLPGDRFAEIDFNRVSSQLVAENNEIVLIVEGEIIARNGMNHIMPALALTIRGEGQNRIFQWTAKPPAETISAGTPIPFKVRLGSPPITGREVLIRFVDASEIEDTSAS